MATEARQKIELLIWGYIRMEIESIDDTLIIPGVIKHQFTEWIGGSNMESQILSADEIDKLHSLLSAHWSTAFIDCNLLYHGISAEQFYEKCGTAHTLCVIEAVNSEGKVNVFGGYTSKKWEKELDYSYSADSNAFLYLIRSSGDYPSAIYPILENRKETAIGHLNNYMCFFGKVWSRCEHSYSLLELFCCILTPGRSCGFVGQ